MREDKQTRSLMHFVASRGRTVFATLTGTISALTRGKLNEIPRMEDCWISDVFLSLSLSLLVYCKYRASLSRRTVCITPNYGDSTWLVIASLPRGDFDQAMPLRTRGPFRRNCFIAFDRVAIIVKLIIYKTRESRTFCSPVRGWGEELTGLIMHVTRDPVNEIRGKARPRRKLSEPHRPVLE